MSPTPSPPNPPRGPAPAELPGTPPDQALELYLDGLLEGSALLAFEMRLKADPALRRQVELQSRIDAEFSRVFAPPAAMDAPVLSSSAPGLRLHSSGKPGGGSAGARPGSGAQTLRRLRYYAAAALLLLAMAGSWAAYVHYTTPKFGRVAPQAVYQRLVAGGFEPEFVCTTEEQFVRTLRERFGKGVRMEPDPGVQLVGWGYGSSYEGEMISPETLVLMARVEGDPVVVLMDKASRDRTLEKPTLPTLQMFRRKVGGLVVYEVTGRGKPGVIDRLEPVKDEDPAR